MVAVISFGGVTFLQYLMVAFFTVAFGWIALAASSAVAGMLLGGERQRGCDGQPAPHRTALVMPVCNEDPARSFAALAAMGKLLLERGKADGFEVFVLSDTSQAAISIKETAAFQALRDALGDRMRVWYRRRTENVGRKAGNLQDFVTRWGAHYDFMIVLDADSVLTAETLVTLVREMQADDRLGLLQTVPRLCGGETLFARLQQFAGAVYGPIVARGMAAWQGNDGNYWGHNAIIRVRAFAGSAGLPELPGRKPFGGTILSHDFVEAALLRRAGWSIRMLPALDGSWEESPPSLLDVAARDRRWAQGNIQHLAVIGASGLRWPSRTHLCIGVMSYLASPIWLGLIAVGLAVSLQVATTQFDYFPDELTLFPQWPMFDSERMFWLFGVAMGTLLLPKALGLLRAMIVKDLRTRVGLMRLIGGVVFETLLSALYAPIAMMMQTRQVREILRGQDSGWAVQSRHRAAQQWRTLLTRHGLHTLLGLGVAGMLAWFEPSLLPWMAPALLGLALAIPLSAASGSATLGKFSRWCGMLVIPEEVGTPQVIALRDEFERALTTQLDAVSLERLLEDDGMRQRHFAAILPPAPPVRGKPDLTLLSARGKVGDAVRLDEALAWLSPRELVAAVNDRELFNGLLRLRASQNQDLHQPARSYGGLAV
jgi:membrane glycosyltransferase